MFLALRWAVLAADSPVTTSAERSLNRVAEACVRLCLAAGQHDPLLVDAFYGPAAWQEEAKQQGKPLSSLAQEARELERRLAGIAAADLEPLGEIWVLRREFLARQLRALEGRIDMLLGRPLTFDAQADIIFDASLTARPESYYAERRARLDRLVPGEGPLAGRVERYEARFTVAGDRLDAVLQAAIAECRTRTRQHLSLPDAERFTIEYAAGKPWNAYNWYQGNARSLIQINTDLPFRLADAIVYAAHEGYPGHHVHHLLLEQTLAQKRGWVEFQVFPLFSPLSLVAEGAADYGVELVLPPQERLDFERRVLFPLAGFDPAEAGRYAEVRGLLEELRTGRTEAARRLLDGKMAEGECELWLEENVLLSRARAKKYVSFVKTYGAYTICYDVGREIVRQHVTSRAKAEGMGHWEVFGELLSRPAVPSRLRR